MTEADAATAIEFSPQQVKAIAGAKEWFNKLSNELSLEHSKYANDKTITHIETQYGPTDMVYLIGGFAGTGKTTSIKELVRQLTEEQSDFAVEYAAFTGKAALVMKRYNKIPARTIHSLIYSYIPPVFLTSFLNR